MNDQAFELGGIMSQVKRWRAVLVVGATALVMSACGGGGDDGGGGSGGAADGDPVAGGSLSLIQMSEPRILDPATMTNGFSTNAPAGNALFGQLLADKSDGTFDYVLAKSLASDDGGKTWVLTLRDGLTFSDGSPMDAEDVAFNWNRMKDPQLGSTSKVTVDYISDLKPEGQVLTFTLTEPIANFGFAITNGLLNWVAKPEALQAGQAAFDKNPIGAGPFVMDSWTRGGKMVLKKNTKYYDPKRPYLDELVLTANGDEGQRFSTVESGGADATMSSSAAYLKRGEENGLKVITQGLNGGIGMALNNRFAPFDDPRAREAVAKAVDLDAVNEAAYEGVGTVPRTLFTEKSPLYSDVKFTGYDKAGAQKLFDELAADGKTVKFTITAYQTSESRRVGEAFQAQLAGYKNVDAKLEVLDFPAATAKTNNREFQMSPVGGVSFADPETALYQALYSTSAGNVTGIKDAQLDAALKAGRQSSDVAERKAAYKIVAERLAALNPAMYYTRTVGALARGEKVAGFELYGNGSPRVDGAWTTKK